MCGTQALVAYNFWAKDTRSTTQFNLPHSNCRCHFNFDSVADRSTRQLLDLRGKELTIRFQLCER